MSDVKTCIKFFTLFDYDKEEKWLREMHKKGWKLRKGGICFTFDKCEPEDVIYKLDFQKDGSDKKNYISMFEDYGWEHIMEFNNYVYFRKSANYAAGNESEELEIFSDSESKIDMMKRILRFRMLPLLIIFLCCVVPNFLKEINNNDFSTFDKIFNIFWIVLMVLYVFLFTKCYLGYKRNKNRILK